MGEPAKILVVDDDPDFLDSIRVMLETHSYRVAVAPCEEEALAQIEAERPSLLILDVMMSDWDSGFRFAWKLRADERYKTIPILVVTAVDKEVRTDFARHANSPFRTPDDESYLPVDGYIMKPVTTEGLIGSVKGILKHAERRAAL